MGKLNCNTESELPPMKFNVGDIVNFWQGDYWSRGEILVADYGGSLEHDYHSYDIEVKEENMLYKHIPERNVRMVSNKLIQEMRLRDYINLLIGDAQEGRFGDRQTAFDALAAVKHWVIDECEDSDFYEPLEDVPCDGTKIRYNERNIIIKGDEKTLLKCVEDVNKITGKTMSHYKALLVDQWLHSYKLSPDVIIKNVKKQAKLNPRLTISYLHTFFNRNKHRLRE